MERKYLFNDVSKEYDKFRPGYPRELFVDILEYSNIDKNSIILEVGCGTGQATQGFVDIGYKNITCVELGKNLADFTAEKFKEEPTIRVHNASFEEWDNKNKEFDVVTSGTAFHFINPQIGYPKAFNLLKPNGTMAFFWTVHVQVYDDLHNKIRELYRKYAPDLDDSIKPTPNEVIKDTFNTINSIGLFKDIQTKEYKWEHRYSREEYISLLNTHSKHRQLNENTRKLLFSGIKEIIDYYGGFIDKPQLVALFLGRK
jgi:SAM-dependent methyltransferase